jgi:hypothetical protein
MRSAHGGIGVWRSLLVTAVCLTPVGGAVGVHGAEEDAQPAARPYDSREAVQQALASGGTLSGADLAALPLAGLEFTGLDLTGTKWFQADLRGARFTHCTLAGADFTATYLNGAVFSSCQLQDAVLSGSSLAGGSFSACDISGAVFTDTNVAGLTLEDVTLFPTGAAHLPAIREAVRLRGGLEVSAEWLAAASGDAFAFTYDRKDRAAWPGTPLTFNPILLAAETLGYDATFKPNMDSEDVAGRELTATLRRGLVAILPMRLAGAGLSGNAVEGGVWVAAYDMERSRKTAESVLVQTPFGPMAFGFQDLLSRWQGPWPTLSPAGE